VDVLFLIPNSKKINYQSLAKKYSAIETPTWGLLLAESCRAFGMQVCILDVNAENLGNDEIYSRVVSINPRILCFVVYGQNVNAGTANMQGATDLSNFLKKKKNTLLIAFIGSHVQALPYDTLKKEKSIDFVFTNEGVYALRNILNLEGLITSNLKNIKGIAFRESKNIIINPHEETVPTNKMDIDLPGYAWDLLPFNKKPFDLYRSPLWHAEYDENKRSPYASLHTSLGCQFKCSFCMINLINRNDEDKVGVASNYSQMRFWSPNFIIKQFHMLKEWG